MTLTFAVAALADIHADYKRACDTPYREAWAAVALPSEQEEAALEDAAFAATQASCTAFAERLSAVSNPTSEERFALFLANEELGIRTYPSEESQCAAMRAFAEHIPDRPGIFLGLSDCADDPDERLALRRMALAVDPAHIQTLSRLTRVSARARLTPSEVARYAAALYAAQFRTVERLRAAALAYAALGAAGDAGGASGLRDRVRGDLGLDDLFGAYRWETNLQWACSRPVLLDLLAENDQDLREYCPLPLEPEPSLRDHIRKDVGLDVQDIGPYRRESNLRWACSPELFDLDLGEFCVSALETLAQESADAGELIPWEVLRFASRSYGHIGGPSHLNHYATQEYDDEEQMPWWLLGRGSANILNAKHAERLKATLRDYPERLWGMDHLRTYADTEPTPESRAAALRRAVDMHPDDFQARCDLAGALAEAKDATAAREQYSMIAQQASLDPRVAPPCDPEQELELLRKLSRGEVETIYLRERVF